MSPPGTLTPPLRPPKVGLRLSFLLFLFYFNVWGSVGVCLLNSFLSLDKSRFLLFYLILQ